MKNRMEYQLNRNKEHNMFYYIDLSKKKVKIKVFETNEGVGEKLVLSNKIPFAPISSGWIGNYIFLLDEEDIIFLDVKTKLVLCGKKPKYKIIDILVLDSTSKYVYTSSFDAESLDFILLNASLNVEKKICTYCLSTEEKKIGMKEEYLFYASLIEKYISEFEEVRKKNVFDCLDNNILQVNRKPMMSEIVLNGKSVRRIFGFVDQAFLLKNGSIIYSSSSFCSPIMVKRIKPGEKNKELCKRNHMHVSTDYYEEKENGIIYYSIQPIGAKKGIVLMLHGGPADRYVNRFEYFSYRLLKAGFGTVLINYPGSIGYGLEYQNRIIGKAGLEDLASVLTCVNSIKDQFPDDKLFLYGDSYGAYLAIMAIIKEDTFVKKAYATNAFTDVRYQYIFSIARSVIEKYFPEIISDRIKQVNPIDLVREGQLYEKLLIINGENDLHCPKEQVVQFENISKCSTAFIQDYPHYKVAFWDSNEMISIILDDLEKLS